MYFDKKSPNNVQSTVYTFLIIFILFIFQLLKGLFGTNAASDPDSFKLVACTKRLLELRGDTTCGQHKLFEQSTLVQHDGLYNGCLMSAYRDMSSSLKLVPAVEVNSLERGYAINYCMS